MASRLTPSEREDLNSALEAIRAAGPLVERERAAARKFADIVHADLSEVDKVTIGRILMRVAAAIPHLAKSGNDPRTIGISSCSQLSISSPSTTRSRSDLQVAGEADI